MVHVARYLFIFEGREGAPSVSCDAVSRQLKELDTGMDYDFHFAVDPDDALRFVSLYCDLHKGLDTCFVSCGGDGLAAGIAGGLMGADEGKYLALFDPGGTGSLARYYEGADFGNISRLITGTPAGIDMIRVNNSYAVNACTFGLDEIMSGKDKGFIASLSTSLRRSFGSLRISIDGIQTDGGPVLFFILSNGRHAPGGILCAPEALNDDGRMDLCIVRNMPPIRLMKLLPELASGGIADAGSFAGDLLRRRARSVEIESSKDMTLMLDGRPLSGKHFKARIFPGAVNMIIPSA